METIAGLGMGVVNGEIVESGECSLLEVVDGCCDVSVVTIGTLSAFGVDDSPVLKIVDEANLRKFGRGHSYRADGKLVKPADFVGPKSELEAFLNYRR